jgi:hypothetical protein
LVRVLKMQRVAQATGLCRPATRRAERLWRIYPIKPAVSTEPSRCSGRRVADRHGRVARATHFSNTLSVRRGRKQSKEVFPANSKRPLMHACAAAFAPDYAREGPFQRPTSKAESSGRSAMFIAPPAPRSNQAPLGAAWNSSPSRLHFTQNVARLHTVSEHGAPNGAWRNL